MTTTDVRYFAEEQLAFKRAEPLNGYVQGAVKALPTDESILVQYGPNKTQAVLKTYNSYRQLDETTYRPFIGRDLSSLRPGSSVMVKVGKDGQLVGVVTVKKDKKEVPRKKFLGIF